MKLPLHPDQYKMVRERAMYEAVEAATSPLWHPRQYMAYAHGLEDAAQLLKMRHNLWEHAEDEKLWNRMMAL